jgi:hypothetical protein
VSFVLKGFQISEGLVQIQNVKPRIEMKYKTHINLCMNYVVHVSSTMRRVKYQPPNPTSCGDNVALLLLVRVVGR